MADDIANKIHGKMYTVSGVRLSQYDFNAKQWIILYEAKNGFEGTIVLNEQEFLTSYNLKKRILLVNRMTGSLEDIGAGHHPLYLKDHHKLAFYRGIPGEARTALYIADYDSLDDVKEIDKRPDAGFTPIQISDDEFLYTSRRSGRHGIWRYNVITGNSDHLSGLRNCALWHSFWKPSTGQLLCSEIDDNESPTQHFYLTNLDGDYKEYIDFGKGNFRPVLYIDEYDVVVLQQSTSKLFPLQEIYPVWLYDMKTGQKEKIASDYMMGRYAIWYPD